MIFGFGKSKVSKLVARFPKADRAGRVSILGELAGSQKECVETVLGQLQTGSLSQKDAEDILDAMKGREAFESVMEGMGSSFEIVRSVCLKVIDGKWGPKAVPEVIGHLESGNSFVRELAAGFLVKYSKRVPVSRMAALLKDKDKGKRRKAMDVLAAMGTREAAMALSRAVEDPDPWTQKNAIKAVTDIGAKEAVGVIRKLLDSDQERGVALAAIEALESVGGPDDAKRLLDLLRSEDIVIRQLAAEVIPKIADASIVKDVVGLIRDRDVNIRRLAADLLLQMRDPNTGKALIAALRDADWWVREIAVEALSKIEIGDLRTTVLKLLKDPDPYIRRIAAEYFCHVRDERSYDSLVALLDDDDWWIREKAILALGTLGDGRAAPLIARHASDADVRLAVPEALGKIGTPEAVTWLFRLAESPVTGIRMKVVRAAAGLESEDGRKLLEIMVKDADADVAEEAHRCLAGMMF